MWDRETGAVIQSSENQQVRRRAVEGVKQRVGAVAEDVVLREDEQPGERASFHSSRHS